MPKVSAMSFAGSIGISLSIYLLADPSIFLPLASILSDALTAGFEMLEISDTAHENGFRSRRSGPIHATDQSSNHEHML